MLADGLAARRSALEVVQNVLERRQPLDQALAQSHSFAVLPVRDRAFVRLIVTTLLRRLGQIDTVLGHCLDRPLPPRAAVVRDVLRIGAVQLLFLRVPPHAAVSTSVSILGCRRAAYRALVNAVLRRLAREGAALLAATDAERVNLPAWLWRSWTAAYGEPATRAIARMLMTAPPLDITVKREPEIWARRLDARLLPTGTLRRDDVGLVSELPGYDEGAWWVQDAAAAIPVRLFGNIRDETVADLCAAPGGKAAQLAAAGARVIAVDRSEPRLARLKQNLARLRLDATVVAADAVMWRPPEPVRFVLLDAPCSATGTLRRHPDALWLKSPEDVTRLTPLQDRLLDAAVEMLAPGGVLVYVTCSLQPEEGPERISALLARSRRVVRRAIQPSEIAGLADLITSDGDLRTLPCHLADLGGVDGFYAARLVRTA